MKPRFEAPPGASPARGWPPHAGGSRSGRMTAAPRGTRGWPGSRRRCGPASAGAASTGRSRTRTPGGAPSRANPHQENDSARAADQGRRTPAAPAAGGARTDSNYLSGVGPSPPLERRPADAHPGAGPNGGDRATEPLAHQRRGGTTPKATNGPRRSADGGPRCWCAGHGPSRSPTGPSRAATPRSRARSARAMGSATAIAIAGRCCSLPSTDPDPTGFDIEPVMPLTRSRRRHMIPPEVLL